MKSIEIISSFETDIRFHNTNFDDYKYELIFCVLTLA